MTELDFVSAKMQIFLKAVLNIETKPKDLQSSPP